MHRLTIAAASLVAVAALFCGATLAHGGFYPGPGDTVPPGGGNPNGPGTPTGPTTPTGPRGAPTTPGGASPTTPTAPGSTGTPMGPGNPLLTGMLQGPNLESWTFWWGYNQNRFLQIQAHVHRIDGVVTTTSPEEIVTGVSAGHDTLAPSKHQISAVIAPALRQALETETNRDVITACLMALAKLGDEPGLTAKLFERFLSSREQEVAETAALSFGILASSECAAPLAQCLRDDPTARALVQRKEVPWRTRAFAAYGLGLLGARTADASLRAEVQETLLSYLRGTGAQRFASRDVRVAAIVSLGLIPDPDRKAVGELERYFEAQRAREEVVCAHVPTSVAKLLHGASPADRERYARFCVAELRAPGRREAQLRPSFAVALGLLTRADDAFAADVVLALEERVDRDLQKSPILAYLSLMALGEIAGTGAPGGEVERYLLAKAQTRGGRVMTRAWSALSLGVAGFDQNERHHQVPNEAVGSALADMMRGEIRDPEQLAAYGLALGLLRCTAAAGDVRACLMDRVKDDAFRGYFALALGLMDEKSAIEPIRSLVKTSVRRPELLRDASIALGLLGDKRVVRTLTDALASRGNATLAVQAAVATALGFVGDQTSVEPLVAMLRDAKKELTTESRAFAAVALGMVGDKEEWPWNFKISSDLNYFAMVETLNEPGSMTGVLNLL